MIADRGPGPPGPTERALAGQPFFDGVGYASCWEDADVLRAALRVSPGDRVLSIASGGCNALSLLLDDPAQVVAVDFNPHQTRLVRLKVAAIRLLPRAEYLALIGATVGVDRLKLWQAVRPQVPEADRRWWDARPGLFARGLYRAGRTDRYLMAFGALVRAWLGRGRVDRLFGFASLTEQQAFYHEVWDDWRWRTMLNLFFHRRVISRAKDPSHFRYVDGDAFGARIHQRASLLFTEGLMRDNPYCALILRGRYLDEQALPAYMKPGAYDLVRERLDRLELRDDPLGEALAASPPKAFDAFNLSNLYDWLSDEARTASLELVCRAARPGARLCYWSTLAPRPLPALRELQPDVELAARLHRQDRFPYAHLEVASVNRPVPGR